MFLHIEQPTAPANGGVVLIYDRTTAPGGTLTFDDVYDHFADRIHLLDALRQRLHRVPGDLDRPYWVEDPDFDLEYHIRNIALPPPGDWRQLCLQVARLAARPLDLSRPVWELYMIDGLDAIDQLPNGSFALVLKVHHTALDGKAFQDVINVLHSVTPETPAPRPPDSLELPPEPPTTADMLGRAASKALRLPVDSTRALAKVLPGLSKTLGKSMKGRSEPVADGPRPAMRAPQTRFNAPVSPHRSYGYRFFALDEAKEIRRAVPGATVGDVALAVFAGAIREYLGEVGELPTTPLRSMVPMAVHNESDRAGLGNHISAMVVELATDVDEPLERLRIVHESAVGAKGSAAAIGPRDLSELLDVVPNPVFAPVYRVLSAAGTLTRRGFAGGVANTMVTGMAGPPEALYLAGAKLVHLLGIGPLVDGMTLINIHSSYNGELMMGFTACRDAIPDPDRYEECIGDSFADLLAAARAAEQARRKAAGKKAAAKKAARSPKKRVEVNR
jgi:WS/DGAT/MGAT family acyltransferase